MNLQDNNLIVLILVFFMSCNSSEKNEFSSLRSTNYSDATSTLDSENIIKINDRIMRLYRSQPISDFDFYIKYNYDLVFASDPTTYQYLLITIKAADSIGYVTYDEIETLRDEYIYREESNAKAAQMHFEMKGISTIMDVDKLMKIKSTLDSIIRHLNYFPMPYISDGGSTISYYDGKKNHFLFIDNVGIKLQRELNSLILNDPLFDSITADFYYKSFLYRTRVINGFVERPDSLTYIQQLSKTNGLME